MLVPTYGHTPGHQSLRVRAGKGAELVLTADACYTRENMDRDLLPGVLWDAGRDDAAPSRGSVSSATATAPRSSTDTTRPSGRSWPRAPEPLVIG